MEMEKGGKGKRKGGSGNYYIANPLPFLFPFPPFFDSYISPCIFLSLLSLCFSTFFSSPSFLPLYNVPLTFLPR
ncbi:hypothetical protein F5X96DRAFT_647539 [Biscogniauxia mediterranea]|nr:hypothetical protein F5X96DRAFT_647539 [Biscogniauxia mediterranea]